MSTDIKHDAMDRCYCGRNDESGYMDLCPEHEAEVLDIIDAELRRAARELREGGE